jgi:Mn-dependent DtxR family transcriptional regulator
MRESGEDYLETVYVLCKNAEGVHAVDVANKLGYSKPSVTRALKLLKSGGYITVDGDNHIRLTELGKKRGAEIYDRHNFIARFLTIHGVSEDNGYRDACLMEHDLSDETFSRIKAFVEERS